jgi:hypothetical protein
MRQTPELDVDARDRAGDSSETGIDRRRAAELHTQATRHQHAGAGHAGDGWGGSQPHAGDQKARATSTGGGRSEQLQAEGDGDRSGT